MISDGRLACQWEVVLDPLRYMIADRRREKFNSTLKPVEGDTIDCVSFLRGQSFVQPIPPAAENTNDEKEPCSTSQTRSSYALLFSFGSSGASWSFDRLVRMG